MPYVTDCKDFHYKIARKLQKKNPQKHAKAKEKAKEMQAKKKQEIELKEESEGGQSGAEGQSVV